MEKKNDPHAQHAIIWFDGECLLCNRAITYVAEHDPEGRFYFGNLGTPLGASLNQIYVKAGEAGTMILESLDGTILVRSDAALAILQNLQSRWSWVGSLTWLPRFVRDAVYNAISRTRRLWFGGTEGKTCPIPPPKLSARLIENNTAVLASLKR